ncbi:MAG: hypothetical protein ACRDF4_09645, partial [Rhabdochlamydiaceae bacterium]
IIQGALKTFEKVSELKEEWRKSKDPDKQKRFELLRGLGSEGALLACIYNECQIHSMNLSIKKMSQITGVRSKWIFRPYRGILTAIEGTSVVHSANHFVPAIASIANVSRKAELRANAIIEKLEKHTKYVEGKDPSGIAASALYIACRENGLTITQKTIAKASRVTEVTIRNRYSQMVKELREIDSTLSSFPEPRV